MFLSSRCLPSLISSLPLHVIYEMESCSQIIPEIIKLPKSTDTNHSSSRLQLSDSLPDFTSIPHLFRWLREQFLKKDFEAPWQAVMQSIFRQIRRYGCGNSLKHVKTLQDGRHMLRTANELQKTTFLGPAEVLTYSLSQLHRLNMPKYVLSNFAEHIQHFFWEHPTYRTYLPLLREILKFEFSQQDNHVLWGDIIDDVCKTVSSSAESTCLTFSEVLEYAQVLARMDIRNDLLCSITQRFENLLPRNSISNSNIRLCKADFGCSNYLSSLGAITSDQVCVSTAEFMILLRIIDNTPVTTEKLPISPGNLRELQSCRLRLTSYIYTFLRTRFRTETWALHNMMELVVLMAKVRSRAYFSPHETLLYSVMQRIRQKICNPVHTSQFSDEQVSYITPEVWAQTYSAAQEFHQADIADHIISCRISEHTSRLVNNRVLETVLRSHLQALYEYNHSPSRTLRLPSTFINDIRKTLQHWVDYDQLCELAFDSSESDVRCNEKWAVTSLVLPLLLQSGNLNRTLYSDITRRLHSLLTYVSCHSGCEKGSSNSDKFASKTIEENILTNSRLLLSNEELAFFLHTILHFNEGTTPVFLHQKREVVLSYPQRMLVSLVCDKLIENKSERLSSMAKSVLVKCTESSCLINKRLEALFMKPIRRALRVST